MIASLAVALLTGRLMTLDGARLDDVQVVLQWSARDATAPVVDTFAVDSAGRFGGLLRDAAGDSISISVLAPEDSPYYAATIVVPRRRLADELRLMLVPKRWAIERGTFAGRTIAIDPVAALRRVPNYGSFGRVTRSRTVGWLPSTLPLSVVLRRDDGLPIGSSDSAAFWDAARNVEAAMGSRFFDPSTDTSMRGRVFPVEIRIDRRISTAGVTFVSWDSEGNIFEASVRFHGASEIRAAGTVQHELMHVLGFGHTIRWPSAMASWSLRSLLVTAEDVAYGQLLMRVHALEQDPLVAGGLLEVVQGKAPPP